MVLRRMLIFLGLWAFSTCFSEAAEPLSQRYGFKSRQQYVYLIDLQLDVKGEEQHITGSPQYTMQGLGTRTHEGITTAGVANFYIDHAELSRKFTQQNAPKLVQRVTRGHQTGLFMTERGHFLDINDELPLPFGLGGLVRLTFPEWPEKATEQWTAKGTLNGAFRDFVPMAMGVEGFDRVNCEWTTKWTIQEETAETLSVTRDYHLRSVKGEQHQVDSTLVGQLQFHRTTGQLISFDSSGHFRHRGGSIAHEIPLKLTLSIAPEDEHQRLKSVWAAEQAARVAPPTVKERSELLEALGSMDRFTVRQSLLTLCTKKPAAPDPELSAAIAAIMRREPDDLRGNAASAFEHWGTVEDEATLLHFLNESPQYIRQHMQAAAGRLQLRSAVALLVAQLSLPSARVNAHNALQKFGPQIEADTLPLLESSDVDTRIIAARLLGNIGTERSLESLQQMVTSDAAKEMQQTAAHAVRQIQQRRQQDASSGTQSE